MPLHFTKSINLAMSERGIHALRRAGVPGLLDAVLSLTIPMHGRMIHTDSNGKPAHDAQMYDARGKVSDRGRGALLTAQSLLSLERTALNRTLLERLGEMPNVRLLFRHKLVGADFRRNVARLERQSGEGEPGVVDVSFDFLIGADGAHSTARYHMMKLVPMAYQQEYIDQQWCEFHVAADRARRFQLPLNFLHIWPHDDAMFIALPNRNGTLTATLFATARCFEALDADSDALAGYFQRFPGVVPALLAEDELREQYAANGHKPLVSIKCAPHHAGSSGVIVGDAAHAMVPFYGQGMNAGLEDVRVLFELLDGHAADRARALHEYTRQRTPDAAAINDLALRNYREMASDVKTRTYRARKWVEETLDLYVPRAGWATQYARVTFSNARYSDVEKASRRQGRILAGVLGVAAASAAGFGWWLARWLVRKPVWAFLRERLPRPVGGV